MLPRPLFRSTVRQRIKPRNVLAHPLIGRLLIVRGNRLNNAVMLLLQRALDRLPILQERNRLLHITHRCHVQRVNNRIKHNIAAELRELIVKTRIAEMEALIADLLIHLRQMYARPLQRCRTLRGVRRGSRRTRRRALQ